MEVKMGIKSATTDEYLQIVKKKARQMAANIAIESATAKEYVQIVTNSQWDGSKYGHNVSNY